MDKQENGHDRRSHKRYPVQHEGECTIRFCRAGANQFQASKSINISYGGVLLVSSVLYSVEDSIDVEISCSDSGRDPVKTVLRGVVRWVEDTIKGDMGEKSYFIGVQFCEISEEQENVLRSFIEKHIMED